MTGGVELSLTGTLSGCFSLIFVASAARTSTREREREVRLHSCGRVDAVRCAHVYPLKARLLTERLLFFVLPLHDVLLSHSIAAPTTMAVPLF